MSETLRKLGLELEDDEHPANTAVLDRLGLKPEDDEHPATVAADNGYNLGSPEERMKTPAAPPKTRLHVFREAIDPSTVLPAVASDVGSNILDYAKSGVEMAGQGVSDIFKTDDQGRYAGQPATGVGRIGMGVLNTLLSPLTGTVKSGENALAGITGNPDFADKAAIMVPLNRGGAAVSSAARATLPSTKAIDLVAERMTPEMLERLKSNPRLRPMDVSKGVRDLAVGVAKDTSQPRAMAPVISSMERSAVTAKDAVRGTYDTSLGAAPPNLYQEYQRLQNQSQTVGRTKIQPSLDAAGPVDTSKVIDNIDNILKPGVQSVASPGVPFQTRLQSELREWRQELMDNGSMLTDANRLHEVQSDLRRYADELMMSPDGQSKRLGRQLKDFRNQLVDVIDKSAPGYKEGLKQYKDTKDISSAFDFGREVLKNTDDIKTDPSYLEQWVNHKNRTPEELEAARLGARQAIEAKMGRIKSSGLDPARSGTDIPQVDFNRQKLETLFGKENTDKMFRHLQDERDIAVTNSRGLANSTTAEAQAAQAVLKPREITQPHSQLPSWATALGLGAGALTSPTVGALVGGGLLGTRAAKMGYDYIGNKLDLSRNASLARLITRNDPETISKLATAIGRSNKRNKLDNLLAPP